MGINKYNVHHQGALLALMEFQKPSHNMALGKDNSSILWIADLDSTMNHLSLHAASHDVSN